MNDDEMLRHLLGELAGSPPQTAGRKEAVMSRVHRRVQRQLAVRGAATAATVALLALGGVGTTQTLMRTGADGHPDRDAVTTEPSHAPHSPEPAATEPSHAPHSPEPSVAPAPSHEPSHAPAPSGDTGGTAPTPESTAASGPLTVSLTMSPGTAATGATVHALVTARDGAGRLKSVHITWGDAKVLDFSPTGPDGCRTTHLDGDFSHAYAAAGSYVVHVTVTSGDSCSDTESVTREGHVTITGSEPSPAPSCTNGSGQPSAGGSPYTGDNATYVYLHAAGSDPDGVVRRIVVSWGDGSSTTVGEWTTGSSHDGNTSHHYATAGDHTVTITVYSGCTSADVQQSSTQVVLNQAQA